MVCKTTLSLMKNYWVTFGQLNQALNNPAQKHVLLCSLATICMYIYN